MARCARLLFAFGTIALPAGGAEMQLLRKLKLGEKHDNLLRVAQARSPTKHVTTTPKKRAPSKTRTQAQIEPAAPQAVVLAKAPKVAETDLPLCTCVANNPLWRPTNRTIPKCVFIDLGAADGNSFEAFLNNEYDPVENCPSGQWEAYLVEANPQFDAPLQELAAQYKGQVHVMPSTAAYTCVGQTSFYIDNNVSRSYTQSGMTENRGTRQGNRKKITVPTTNVVQLIAESVTPTDWVILKVDIEGAEYDIVPCLAESASATLVDRMYLEEHACMKSGPWRNGQAEMEAAKKKLLLEGVDMPWYSRD